MTQAERDRLVTLKKAKKKLITQRQAAEDLGCTERQIRRMLKRLAKDGDKSVIHGLRGEPSNRRLAAAIEKKAVKLLSAPVYEGFGPTLATEYLAKKHQIEVSKETTRAWMIRGGLWKGRKAKVAEVHQWRPRRNRCGEMVQWDTSDHDWLEGRGPRIYLIAMIDDATSRLTARFVEGDTTVENMKLLEQYLRQHGRPRLFYTDKASLFQTALKRPRDQGPGDGDARAMPPTQIGRALRELGIAWQPAHSAQAKGRVERNFLTAQDRLVKGLRVAGACTLEQANAYLETGYLPWWEENCTVTAAHPDDAHRPAFAKAWPESIGPMQVQTRIGVPLPLGSKPSPRTRRKERALPIVRDEFRVDYSLIGLLAGSARLRIIDRSSLSGDLRPGRRHRTFLLCQQADISTLP